MSGAWSEVETARVENRHELVLTGGEVAKRVSDSDGELDRAIFGLANLNFLEISRLPSLNTLPKDIRKLTHLTNLVLHSNRIAALPKEIGQLTKLKVLDISSNQLEELPESLCSLTALTTLNAGSNSIVRMPCMKGNPCLTIVDVSNNKMETFPDVCYPELNRVSEIKANGNQIRMIPAAISGLVSLKVLDLRNNAVVSIPGQLSKCTKLKDIHLQGNKLSDRRLLKLVEGGAKSAMKPVLDYIRNNCPMAGEDGPGNAGSGGKRGNKSKGKSKKNDGEAPKENDVKKDEIRISRDADSTPVVTATNPVMDVRPHLVCCIIRDVSMNADTFKRFIQLQTQLHDTTCEKRVLATIATHDLSQLPSGGLTYDGRPPSDLKLQPLGRTGIFSAQDLFQQLHKEAEIVRKEKKRSTFSGIHKFLHLLEGKPLYPCLLDGGGNVISLPPITNSDLTKIQEATHSILVEVSSSSSQLACRKVADALLLGALRMGIGAEEEGTGEDKKKVLKVEQVRVVDSEGKLRAVYPSREDLQGDSCDVTITRPI